MLMSSNLPPTDSPVLDNSNLSDIAPIFNLIQLGSRHGQFSNLYTRPRYMAGLGIQLFSLWTSSRIRLPDGIWHQAHLKVLRVGNRFAGFVILRWEVRQPNEVEIYMCGVENDFRGTGLGEWMLRAALSAVPSRCSLFADCLPNSTPMKSLLNKLGFEELGLATSTTVPGFAQRFVRK